MPSSSSKRVQSSGILGLLVAICAGVAYYLVRTKDGCLGLENYNQIQTFHIVGIVTGLVLCLCGILTLTGVIRGITIAFYIAVVSIILIGCLMIYTAVLEFKMPCNMSLEGAGRWLDSAFKNKEHNIFAAQDVNMIAVFLLDIFSGFMLFSATGAMYRS